VIVYPARAEAVREKLRDTSDADVIVKASGVGVFDEPRECGVLETPPGDARVVYWDEDAPATLERIDANPADPVRELLPA